MVRRTPARGVPRRPQEGERRGPRAPGAAPGDWARRAADAIAGFTSTRSKTPDAMFGGPGGPSHFVSAEGCDVVTTDGRTLLDWTMALGAVPLGYAHPVIAESAARAAYQGGVGPLAPALEVEVAERLVAAYPGAGLARFFKSGAEAVAAAVRLARVATGRDAVVYCGYHGWLDGPTSGEGVPAATSGLWHAVPFGDAAALREAVRLHAPAAIVLEPVIEREPPIEWLEAARLLASETGTMLVFDEIKTAFRLARGGAAERYGIVPDLAVLGKGLANGFPLAAVVGRADIMARTRSTWISSTLATEFVSLAAARAVLEVWDDTDVSAHLRRVGAAALAAFGPLCGAAGVQLTGLPEMWLLRFPDDAFERSFLLGCAERGVLLKRGAYNFPSLAHDEEQIDRTAAVMKEVLETLA